MKFGKFKISALGLGAGLAATAAILPATIISTTKTNVVTRENNDKYIADEEGLNNIPSNINPVKIPIDEFGSYLWVQFYRHKGHPEWGTFGKITSIVCEKQFPGDRLVIPATVVQDGVEYKIRQIGYESNIEGKRPVISYDGHTIKCLDLSQAIWLDTIETDAFAFQGGDRDSKHHAKIQSVNFKGARNLRIIGKGTFAHQYFTTDVSNTIDLSTNTKLEIIDNDAFYACCDDNKNIYESIVLPPTLLRIGDDAFSTSNEKCRIKFKKVVFTDKNPNDNLFIDGIPRVADKNAQDIIVPFGCRDKYINLKHFDRTYAKNVRESSIHFDTTEHGRHGSLKLRAQCGISGFDSYPWVAFDKDGKEQKDVKFFVSNIFGDNSVNIDENGCVMWSDNIPYGEHKLRVYAYRYDDPEHKNLSVACSDEIILTREV